MVGFAAEGECVDVGESTIGPFLDMVDLAEVSRHIATGGGAAAVLGVQHDSLIGAGDPLSATEVQSALGVLLEDAEVVPGVGGHPDQIWDG